MKNFFLKTEHIGFSKWTDEDSQAALLLWGEEDVTRYICANGRFTRQDVQKRLLLEISNQEHYNVQYWPIYEILTGALIGCCGLRPFPGEENAYEIGFHLRKIFWGQGYAFEAAAAVIKYAFLSLQASTIYAGHHPQNIASGKLLCRLGFHYIGDHFYPPTGLNHPSYELRKSDVTDY